MFCCTLLYIHSSIAIILMGKRELIALLNLSSWCLVMVERLFLAMPRGFLQFVIVVFPDHTHLLFLLIYIYKKTTSGTTMCTCHTIHLQPSNITAIYMVKSGYSSLKMSTYLCELADM